MPLTKTEQSMEVVRKELPFEGEDTPNVTSPKQTATNPTIYKQEK